MNATVRPYPSIAKYYTPKGRQFRTQQSHPIIVADSNDDAGLPDEISKLLPTIRTRSEESKR